VSFKVTKEIHFNINGCRVTPKIGFTIVFDRITGHVCEFTSEYPIVYHGVFIKEHTKVELSATGQRLAACILGRTQVFNGMVIPAGLYCEFDPAFTNLNVLKRVKGFNWDLNGFQVVDEAKMGHLHPPTVDIFVGSSVKLGELTIPSQHLGLIFTRLSIESLGMAIRLEHDIVYEDYVIPAGHMLLLSHRFNVLVGIAPPYPQATSMPAGLTVHHTIEYKRRKNQPDIFYKFLDLVRSGYLQEAK